MSLRVQGEYARVSSTADANDEHRHALAHFSQEALAHKTRESINDGDLSEAVAYIKIATDEAFDHHAHSLAVRTPDRLSADASSSHTALDKQLATVSTTSRRFSSKGSGLGMGEERLGPKPRMWNSAWLHHSVLITFAGVFAAMLVTVVTLYQISAANNGLSTQVESRHYAWTYGPTALLTVIVSLWRNIDFANRRLAPWRELQDGPSPASKTFLLDYISPMIPAYLIVAVKVRHWAVVASTTGVLLLKLTTVLSTGLIALEPTVVSTKNNPFSLRSKFSADNFMLDNVTGTPGNLYYGIRTQNLPYPKGTSSDLVVQDFQPEIPLPLDAVYSAEVQGFKSNLDREVVEIDNSTIHRGSLPWYSVLAPTFLVDINAGNCSIQNALVAEAADHSYHHNPNATQNSQGRLINATCSDGIDNSLPYTERPDHTITYPD